MSKVLERLKASLENGVVDPSLLPEKSIGVASTNSKFEFC